MEISTWSSTFVPNFSQFEELQILGPNLPKIYETFFKKYTLKSE